MELKQTLGEVKDSHGHTWGVLLLTEPGTQPRVHFDNWRVPGAIYNLSQLIPIGAPRAFRISRGELTDPIYTIAAKDVQRIAEQALERVDSIAGRYEVRWVPNDPRVPF